MSGHAEGLMLSLNVWLLKCGATKRCTCIAFKSTTENCASPEKIKRTEDVLDGFVKRLWQHMYSEACVFRMPN